MNEEWMLDALCAQVGGDETWFPDRGNSAAAAKKVCMGCPVLLECREYALNADEPLAGIWGALSARERTQIRMKQKKGAA